MWVEARVPRDRCEDRRKRKSKTHTKQIGVNRHVCACKPTHLADRKQTQKQKHICFIRLVPQGRLIAGLEAGLSANNLIINRVHP